MTSIEKKLKNKLREALREQTEIPKGIKIGDVYTSHDLYVLMRRYLSLCGDPLWRK